MWLPLIVAVISPIHKTKLNVNIITTEVKENQFSAERWILLKVWQQAVLCNSILEKAPVMLDPYYTLLAIGCLKMSKQRL